MEGRYRHGRPTIGILTGWEFYWVTTSISYLHLIFRGIRHAAQDLDCNLLLGCGMEPLVAGNSAVRPAWPLSSPDTSFVPIGPWNTDGLIAVNPLQSKARSRYMQEVIASGHPVMFIASGERGPTIVADNASGILEAIHHLVEHGHRRIAFIAGRPEDLEGDSGDRLRAYQLALHNHGLPEDPQLVAYGHFMNDGGYAAMRKIIESGATFTAVMASNDDSALGAIRALEESGRHVPRDVAVIGFDDRPVCVIHDPSLSSVHIPLFNMGYRAVETLLRRIEGHTDPVNQVQVPTRLVTRESCGCSPGQVSLSKTQPPARQLESIDRSTPHLQLVQDMVASILDEAQSMNADQVQLLCQRLVDAFIVSVDQNDRSNFGVVVEDVLQEVIRSGDDIHIWQSAISVLRGQMPNLGFASAPPAAIDLARDLLDQARVKISAHMRRQHWQYIANQEIVTNRVGSLATQLLSASDETQVFQILARHLPEMDIRTAWVALFEAEGDDPVSWSLLHDPTAPEQTPLRFRSREFPPEGLLPRDRPFNLALLPLVRLRSGSGYVTFDIAHLELIGVIGQQVAAGFNAAQLHREATEGRHLAEEANHLKSRFLSTVSHELRTPLNLIVGLSEILLQESEESNAPLPDSFRQDVEHINANAQHLGQLISDVLDLASSDAGKLRLANEFVNLGQALRMVAETGRQMCESKGLEWQARLPESGPWVWGDRTRLRQVVLNLVNNAVKFTTRGQVLLTLEPDDTSVTVAVRDTGLGIPPEEQPIVFDEFRRSERSIALGYGGLGLGLAICKRLVEMHGGTIGVRSTGAEGAGATFYFTLPTVRSPESESTGLNLSPLTTQNVLVLTGHPDGGERLREHLSLSGIRAQLVWIDKLSERLSQLSAQPPDVIVLDMSMAPQTGWETIKTLKDNPALHSTPVLILSLSGTSGSVLQLDYMTKPIGIGELTQAVNKQLLVADAQRAAKTILIVDDDTETLEMHARIVETRLQPHRALKAHNGREALKILEQEAVDLVLLDLLMPELDGFGVLQAMRETPFTRDIPVIVLTGQVLTEKDMARLNRDVATVLNKGVFSVDETLAHVDAALERMHKLNVEAQRLVRQAMAFLHEHYGDPISREDVARHVGMNCDYLTFCFRKELGMTPTTYLNRYRLNRAKWLLKNGKQSITDIAFAVGFRDSGYFSRVFRREVGTSPEAFRRT